MWGLWGFVATHVRLWKSLREHVEFNGVLKRLGSVDNNTSIEEGLSPLKQVGPSTGLDKLYTIYYIYIIIPSGSIFLLSKNNTKHIQSIHEYIDRLEKDIEAY